MPLNGVSRSTMRTLRPALSGLSYRQHAVVAVVCMLLGCCMMPSLATLHDSLMPAPAPATTTRTPSAPTYPVLLAPCPSSPSTPPRVGQVWHVRANTVTVDTMGGASACLTVADSDTVLHPAGSVRLMSTSPSPSTPSTPVDPPQTGARVDAAPTIEGTLGDTRRPHHGSPPPPPLLVAAPCDGSSAQHFAWTVGAGWNLVHIPTGLCVTGKDGQVGNQLDLWACEKPYVLGLHHQPRAGERMHTCVCVYVTCWCLSYSTFATTLT